MEPDNPLMRKKKTPEELAAEAELEDQDDFTSKFVHEDEHFGTNVLLGSNDSSVGT